jgi:hypothetical protein
MSVSGHTTLKEIERYTKAANRSRLADSAMATLQNTQKEDASLGKQPTGLANTPGTVSQFPIQTIGLIERKNRAGGGGGIRTHETVARLPVFKTGAFNHSATPPKRSHHLNRRP